MENNYFKIKISHKDTIKIFSIKNCQSNFTELITYVKNTFNLKNEFNLYYIDEENDCIKIESENDLKELIVGKKTLRIQIHIITSKNTRYDVHTEII